MFGFSLCREEQNHSLWTLLLNDVFATKVHTCFTLLGSSLLALCIWNGYRKKVCHPLMVWKDRAPSRTKKKELYGCWSRRCRKLGGQPVTMEDFFGGPIWRWKLGRCWPGGERDRYIDVYISIYTCVYLCFVTCFLVILFWYPHKFQRDCSCQAYDVWIHLFQTSL